MKRHMTSLGRTLALGFILVTTVLAASGALALEATAPRSFEPVQNGFTPDAGTVLPYHPERILIKFKPEALDGSELDISRAKGASVPGNRTGIASIDALCNMAGVKRISRPWVATKRVNLASELGLDLWFMLETDGAQDPAAMADRFAADRAISEATVDWRAFPAAVPTDPMHDLHWGHNNTAQMLSYNFSAGSHEAGSAD